MNQMRLLYFLAVVVLAGLGLFFEAKDSHYSHTQANAIVQDDQAAPNPNAGATAALRNLQNFVKTHMGSSVSFTLTGSYNRAQSAAQAANAAQASNASIYAAAQAACSGKTDSLVQARCNAAYLQSHLPASTPTPVAAPKLSDYQYNLKAPVWSPDLAGALLLGALIALVLLLFSLLKPRRRMY
jgi:hypothetical protein